MQLMMTLKMTKKLSRDYTIWNVFLGLRCDFFKNETSVLVFVESAIFHSIWIRMRLQKIVRKILGNRYDALYILFGFCPCTSCIPKFWHTCVIMVGDFMVTVEPCLDPGSSDSETDNEPINKKLILDELNLIITTKI